MQRRRHTSEIRGSICEMAGTTATVQCTPWSQRRVGTLAGLTVYHQSTDMDTVACMRTVTPSSPSHQSATGN